jgi:hypothetical protein
MRRPRGAAMTSASPSAVGCTSSRSPPQLKVADGQSTDRSGTQRGEAQRQLVQGQVVTPPGSHP